MKNGVFLGKKAMILMVGMPFLAVLAVTGGNPGLTSATLALHSPEAGAPARPSSQLYIGGTGQPSIRFIQLTHTLSDFPVQGCEYPSLNLGGSLVGFSANLELVPGRNPENNSELFLMTIKSGEITQLTSTTSGIQSNISLDGSGKKIAFASNSDLIPGENVDLNSEIFVMNTGGGGLKQVTHTIGGVIIGGNCLPSIDKQGKNIVFSSTLDLIPGQNSIGNNEIFMVCADGTGLRQLTSGPFSSYGAYFDTSGTKILFVSYNNNTGENPELNEELFMMNLTNTEVVQLTHTASSAWTGGRLAADSAMKKVVFDSRWDYTGSNPDGNNEIFILDIESGQIIQLTFTVGGRGCWAPSISGSGNIIAFSSDRDLVPGSNIDEGREIFLAVFERP